MNTLFELMEQWERNRERYEKRLAEGKSADGTKARLDRLTAQVMNLCRGMEESA